MVVPLNRRSFLSWIKKAAVVAGISTQINANANEQSLAILVVESNRIINARDILDKLPWEASDGSNEHYEYFHRSTKAFIPEHSKSIQHTSRCDFYVYGEVVLIEYMNKRRNTHGCLSYVLCSIRIECNLNTKLQAITDEYPTLSFDLETYYFS